MTASIGALKLHIIAYLSKITYYDAFIHTQRHTHIHIHLSILLEVDHFGGFMRKT